jgi:hypothetical protein
MGEQPPKSDSGQAKLLSPELRAPDAETPLKTLANVPEVQSSEIEQGPDLAQQEIELYSADDIPARPCFDEEYEAGLRSWLFSMMIYPEFLRTWKESRAERLCVNYFDEGITDAAELWTTSEREAAVRVIRWFNPTRESKTKVKTIVGASHE